MSSFVFIIPNMSGKRKIVEMEMHQFVVLGTLTMYTFIDFVAVMTNSIFRMYPQDIDQTSNGGAQRLKAVTIVPTGPQHPVWASVGMGILTLPGIFLISQTDGPLKDGLEMIKKFKSTLKLKYCFKLFGYAIGIVFFPAMLLTTQLIAIWQNDVEWFNLVMLLAGLQALFNSFPHLCHELYMLLNGNEADEAHKSQYFLITTSLIFLISNAIRFDLIANKVRFHSWKEKAIYGFKVLPQHVTCIIFRVMSFVLTFTFIHWYALLPTILYVLEIMILVGYTVAAEWDIVYNIGLTNIGMMNIGFVKFLSDKSKFPEDLNKRLKRFVRLSSVVTFLHHSVILCLLLVLEKHGTKNTQEAMDWRKITIWKTERNPDAKTTDAVSFYLIFNNVIAVGVINLCLSLYASREIEVEDEPEANSPVGSDQSETSNMRPRTNTNPQDLWRLSSVPVERPSASTNPGAHNDSKSRGTHSPRNSGHKDSDSEDEEEQLELV